jgi:hypothetical protein
MRLLSILETVNQIERTAFLRILDGLCNEARKSDIASEVERLLSASSGSLKNVDDANVVALFQLLSEHYAAHLLERLSFGDRQLSVLVDILIRDGNAIMSREWFERLYTAEHERLRAQVELTRPHLKEGRDAVQRTERQRDYAIYYACTKMAYENDLQLNRDSRVSWDERTILNCLAQNLDLCNDEARVIELAVSFPPPLDLDGALSLLKDSGVIFFQRKTNQLFVPDEVIWLLRGLLGVELATKYQRRVLRHLSDGELNRIAKRHNIDTKLERDPKVAALLNSGLSLRKVLDSEIFRQGTSKSDRAARIQTLMQKELEVDLEKFGRSLEQKIETMVGYFKKQEREEGSTLSADGYDKLLSELDESVDDLNERIRAEFELQPRDVMNNELLRGYSIQPRDVLYLVAKTELKPFCRARGISARGNLISNVITAYRNVDDLLLENIELIGARDIKGLQEKGLAVKESELGGLFEKLVKKAFAKLGLDVDDKLLKRLNTTRSKMDVLINLGNEELMVVECKTVKDKHYDKYAAVKRQLKSYEKLCTDRGYRVRHVMVVANEFSEDFVGECEYDEELSLSLLTSHGLHRVVDSFADSRRSEFPIKLLLKAGLLNEERIAKVLSS